MDANHFAQLCAGYLKHCKVSKSLSGNSLAAYSQDLEEFARFRTLSDDSSHMCPATILAFVDFLQERRGLKPASVRRRIACLRGFLKWLEKGEHIDQTPFKDLDLRLQLPRKLPRALTRSQVSAITKAALSSANGSAAKQFDRVGSDTTCPSFTTQLAIRLLLATGVRVGELTSIKLSDVTSDGCAIRILGKGSRERTVFIGNPRLQSDLASHLRARTRVPSNTDHLLLNQRGGPLTPQGLRLRLKRISDELHISPRVTPHRFRHTAATLLIEEGLDIRLVQRLLGHSSISTTEIYTHVSDMSLKSAIAAADPIGKLGL